MANFLKAAKLFCLLSFARMNAQDLGVYGHTFPISEENLLEYLAHNLQKCSEEEIMNIQKSVQRSFVQRLQEPKPVQHLLEASKKRTFYFDPTVCVQQDISDHEGRTVIKKGTCVNPLEHVVLTQDLLFFDGTQESHLKWAKSQSNTAKWVLIKGRPLELEETEDRPVFFDQFGILTKKLDIRQVPAKVSQEGSKLKIEELPIREALCGHF